MPHDNPGGCQSCPQRYGKSAPSEAVYAQYIVRVGTVAGPALGQEVLAIALNQALEARELRGGGGDGKSRAGTVAAI